MKKLVSALLGLALLTACGGGSEEGARAPAPVTITSLTVFPSTQTLKIGETKQYTVTAKDSNGNIRQNIGVEWSTGNPALAAIDTNGLLTAKDDGSTTVRATHQGIESQFVTVTITRTPAPPPVVPPVTPPIVPPVTPPPPQVSRASLPPWLSYCAGICNAFVPFVAVACPESDRECVPARFTTVLPQVDGEQISGILFEVNASPSPITRLISGDGEGGNGVVWAYHVPSIQFKSDLDVSLSS